MRFSENSFSAMQKTKIICIISNLIFISLGCAWVWLGAPKDGQSPLGYFISSAYAQEGLGEEAEEAALRRKDKRSELGFWEEKRVIGENKSGLVEIRTPEKANFAVQALVKSENNDRMIIYQALAKKNGTSVEQVQNLYAKRLQSDAPEGTPIEEFNESTGAYEWHPK